MAVQDVYWRWTDPHPWSRSRWEEYFINYSPVFKGLVWFYINDRGVQRFCCTRTLGLDGYDQ